jgi:hypothetical protein
VETEDGEMLQDLDDLAPEHRARFGAAVRLLIDYLLDTASLPCENGTTPDATSLCAAEIQAVQLRLEL